jgi:hypothetical protein
MPSENGAPEKDDPDGEVPKEEIKLQFHWYLMIFFIIYYFSYVISGFVFMFFIIYVFVPYVLLVDNLITLLTTLESILSFIALPIIIIFSYLSRLYIIGLITRMFWSIAESRSPTKDGIIPRNIPSKAANYYHIKSFMIKYGKRTFMKGVFPWLANWFFNFIGTSVIEKGSTLEESVVTDKNVIIGENCYLGVNSALASHVVEGIFGNISYFKVVLGDNVTLAGFNTIGPGNELSDNSYLLPMAAATKHNKTKGNNYYYGMPLRRIFKKKTMEYLKVSEDDLNRAEELRIRQESEKLGRKPNIKDEEVN